MAIEDIDQYFVAGKNAIEMVKGMIGLLPKGPESERAASEIERAERALETSKAEVAQALGFKLCKCTFPPQIMLWQEEQRANVCPRPECGHSDKPPPPQKARLRSWTDR